MFFVGHVDRLLLLVVGPALPELDTHRQSVEELSVARSKGVVDLIGDRLNLVDGFCDVGSHSDCLLLLLEPVSFA